MKYEQAQRFNQEVEAYRRALLWSARTSNWEAFKSKAAKLFDYVESVEHIELEKRFFSIFYAVLGLLVLVVIALAGVNFEISPDLIKLKNTVIVAALATSGFELYFFLNYQWYLSARISIYQERRERFVRAIESDFRGFAITPETVETDSPELSKAA